MNQKENPHLPAKVNGDSPEDPTPNLPKKRQGGGNTPRETWPVSMDNLRRNTAHCSEQGRRVIADVFTWAINHNVTRMEMAIEAGLSENTIYKIITGKYTHDKTGERLPISDKYIEACSRWLDRQKRKASKESAFVLTPTARKVAMACDYAARFRKPVFLWGPSQLGKTWALQHYARENNHGRTVYIRVRSSSSLGGLMSIIARRIGASLNKSRDRMRDSIFSSITPDMILLFDEVHELLYTYRKGSFFECAEFLREIADVAQCGIILSLTNLGRDKLFLHRREELEQMFRRSLYRFQLGTRTGQPLKGDIEAILAAHGLEMPGRKLTVEVEGIAEKPHEIIRQLSRDEGLGAITTLFDSARHLAVRRNSAQWTWEDFVRAHLLLQNINTPEEDWS